MSNEPKFTDDDINFLTSNGISPGIEKDVLPDKKEEIARRVQKELNKYNGIADEHARNTAENLKDIERIRAENAEIQRRLENPSEQQL